MPMRYASNRYETNYAQALGGGEWFKFDLEMHQAGRESWFQHLSSVAMTILVQWVRINSGFRQAGGVPVEMNRESYSRLLMLIPTPPFAGNTYPQFEIEDQSLEEWLNTITDDDITPFTVTKQDVDLHNIRKDADSVQETSFPLPYDQVFSAVQEGNAAGQAVSQTVKEAIGAMPVPRFHHEMQSFAARVPPSAIYCPDLTPTDFAWVSGNSITKVKITIMIAKQELEAWRMFRATCSAQMSSWEQSIEELEETCRLLDDAHGSSARFDEFAQEATAKEAELSNKVATAKQHPYTNRYLERKRAELHGKPTPAVPKMYVRSLQFVN